MVNQGILDCSKEVLKLMEGFAAQIGANAVETNQNQQIVQGTSREGVPYRKGDNQQKTFSDGQRGIAIQGFILIAALVYVFTLTFRE